MAQSSGVEHSVPLPAHGADAKGPPLEKQLNGFVKAVVRIERLGNALGTLAFTWATVVLLGGFSLDLYDRIVMILAEENAASSTASTPAPAPSDDNAKANLAPSLGIFYGMVLGQGALYLVACGLEKCMERNVLASNVLAPEISLCNFAIDSLNSDSTKRQLHGIRIVHILLQRDPATRTRLLVKLTAEMMTRLLRMLDWTGQGHETIRLVAVKVIDELARDLLIVTVPGIVQNVSLLLDCAEDGDRFLRKVAGQALAMLAMGNVDNCRAMLSEDTGYSIVKELTNMIQVVRCFPSGRNQATALLDGARDEDTPFSMVLY
nr:unnamed protein product [Digitaria exilis]